MINFIIGYLSIGFVVWTIVVFLVTILCFTNGDKLKQDFLKYNITGIKVFIGTCLLWPFFIGIIILGRNNENVN